MLSLACARATAEVEQPEPNGPSAAPVIPEAPAPKRVRAPVDPPPSFTDPNRRARLAAAFPEIERYLASTVKRDRLVGLAAAVVIDGEVAWFSSWGHRDPARQLPIERDTVFGVGSISKTVTTLALLRLRDEGRVELDRPAATYLPELEQILYPTTDSPKITIRHILTHSSGLPRMGRFPEYPATPPDRAAFLATLAGLGLERAPGEGRVYSNLGFQLLGPLIENVAGVDHRAFAREAILLPLGMTGAAWREEDVSEDRLAFGHERGPDGAPRARPPWQPGATDAAGGLYASVDDLARYVAFNLDAWPPRSDPETGPLRRSTVREAHTLQRIAGMHFTPARGGAAVEVVGTGLAFAAFATCRHDFIVGHNGKTLSYRATVQMLPTRGVGVILLSNYSSISSAALPGDALKVLDLLADTGALEPRRHVAADALLEGAADVGALIGRWDRVDHGRTFSDAYRDAHPVHGTEQRFAEWRGLVGGCRAPRPIEVVEPRAGVVELACDRGALRLDLRVAPWSGGEVTELHFVGAVGLEVPAEHRQAAARALKLINRWDRRAHAQLFTAALDAAR
ncbi:MAG: beta-lactamase family protein, partial [Myxococcales bacterium]|nr:beta-lactamase family protein [Myxococcales bacterium]